MSSTDLRALGRFGEPPGRRVQPRRRRRLATRPVRGIPAATRRPRLPRAVVVAAAVVVVVLAYVGVVAVGQGDEDAFASLPAVPASDDLDAAGPRLPDAGERASRSDGTSAATTLPFADVDGLELVLPHAEPVLVAFHEALLAEALELTPVGRLEANDNPTKFTGGRERAGPAFHVLSSRGRPRPATSAADVVVPQGGTILAPVTGTVTEVRQYALYGSTRDWRVVIEPHGRPDLHVVLIHLHEPSVVVGDEVTAGQTPLAAARKLSFASQVDYVAGDGFPHVHLEVKPATRPRPVDPNAPAVEPEEALGLGDS